MPQESRTLLNLNPDWRFLRGEVVDGGYKGLDDTSWRTVSLPHDWSVEEPFDRQWASGTGYLTGGTGWYRKHFTLPDGLQGKAVWIEFGGVYKNSQVWCNSNYLGKRPYGYTSFSYEISDFLVPGDNVISVRVDHPDIADSRWFTGTGIYRDVSLTIADPVHFARHGIFISTEEADEKHARLSIHWESVAPSAEGLSVRFLADGFSTKGDGPCGETSLEIDSPRLWTPEQPFLYRLQAELYQNGVRKDCLELPFGIRTFCFDADRGFFLNGVSRKLKGVCVHHDAGALGAAVPKAVWRRRLEKLRQMGCDAIRMSHNPPDPKLLDLCDEMGFFVMDEAFDEWEGCKNKWWQGHNVYPPKHYGYYEEFPQWHEADLSELVRRDRNHPSVILWSIGNEIDYPNDPYGHPAFQLTTGNNDANKPEQERRYDPNRPNAERLAVVARELVGIVKKHDTTRPVTAALALPELSNETGYAAALDIVGYNYKEHLYEADHARFPGRVIYGSENSNAAEQWLPVAENDYICGQFLWTGIDFMGEAHGWPVRISQAGNLTMAGFEKPLYYRRKALWCDEPFAALTARPVDCSDWDGERLHWNWKAGEAVEVFCYTNCERAELFLNGASLGIQAAQPKEPGRIAWRLPYAPGELRAVGFHHGEEYTAILQTAGDPAGIVLEPYPSDRREIIQVELTLRDASGNPVVHQDVFVAVQVEGGTLLGMESGSPVDLTSYAEPIHPTYRGKMIVYLRADKESGSLRLTASADGIDKAVCELTL